MSSPVTKSGNRPLEQLKVAELKEELKKRGLGLKGVKKDLVERLEEAMRREGEFGWYRSQFENLGTIEQEPEEGNADEAEFEEGDESLKNTGGGSNSVMQDVAVDRMDVEVGQEHPRIEVKSTEVQMSGVNSASVEQEAQPELDHVMCGNDGGIHDRGGSVCSGLQCKQTELSSESHDPPTPSALGIKGDTGPIAYATENPPMRPDNSQGASEAPCLNPPMRQINLDAEPGSEGLELKKSHKDVEMTETKQLETMDSTLEEPVSSQAVQWMPMPKDPPTSLPSVPEMQYGAIDNEAEKCVLSVTSKVNGEYDEMQAANAVNRFPSIEDSQERVLDHTNEFVDSLGEKIHKFDEMDTEKFGHKSVGAEKIDSEDKHIGGVEVMESSVVKKEYEVEVAEVKKLSHVESMEHDTQIYSEETTKDFGEEEKCKIYDMGSQKLGYEHVKAEKRVEETEKQLVDGSREWSVDSSIIKKEHEFKPGEMSSRIHPPQKRKDEDHDARQQQEPAKRQRRWNSGNKLTVEATKSPSIGTAKEMVYPESREVAASSNASGKSTSSTPKILATSRPAPSPLRPDALANGEKERHRFVPPATRSPTPSLRIDRFLRPFTLKAVKELLSRTGIVTEFWMDQIKTHCYVTYSSVAEAIASRTALYDLQWPPVFGNLLVAEFVEPEEVKIRLEGQFEKAAVTPSTTPRAALLAPVTAQAAPPAPPLSIQPGPLPPLVRERPAPPPPPLPPPPPKKEPDPPIPTLDDLFKKTKAKPHIYYLPLTNDEVAAKSKEQKLQEHPVRV